MNTDGLLNPTLWRTCRMLSGSTRIRLLRLMNSHPGQNVSSLADSLGISRPYASQELRRIQSRGFLARTHQGSSLVYLFHADPQVPSAAPLLKALRKTLTTRPPARDIELALIASGLGHERRIALGGSLLRSPKTADQLLADIPMSRCSFNLHLRMLMASGFLNRDQRRYHFRTPPHPLGRALTGLLRHDILR